MRVKLRNPTQGENALDDGSMSYWDRVSHQWTWNPRHRLWRTHSDRVNCRLLVRWLPAKKVDRMLKTDLFDELVSEGIVPLLAGRAKGVFCIDTSLFALRKVQKWPAGPRKIGADVRSLPFADGVFDVVVSNSTLDHFRSPDEIASSLRELYRVLRSEGHLILTLDNLANPAIFVRNRIPFKLLNRFGIVPYYVGISLRPNQLQKLLEKTGFEIMDIGAIMHCPRVFAVAVSNWIERRLGPKSQKRFLRFLLSFERVSDWPTRFLTGNFIAVKAKKRSSPDRLRNDG